MSSDSDDFDDNEIDANPDDVFKILITTDNHLGFMEKDGERGQDSFISFEEALLIAKKENVDFILLGGDLFHENKPSRDCLTKCQKMLREHCLGDKPIEFDIVSDENMNFGHTGFPRVNFNDPNLNVGIPVFSIHGNHDDPTGADNLCALDILAAAGLVNYFGKCNTTQSDIMISPVLLEKGKTKLAIYGLGAMKDERLHYMFEKGAVHVNRPSEDTEDWFNIFCIHQNRTTHGRKNYIPETFLPNFLDLVVWGHEHECRIRPEYNELNRFYVIQPGSTVITALCESEAVPKQVAILKIYKKQFKMDFIPLRTTRQFIVDHIILSEELTVRIDKNIETKIEQCLINKVEKMLDECRETRFGNEKQPLKPLVRLKVDYTGFDLINENRFAQKFLGKVANPKSILQFYRHTNSNDKSEKATLDPEAAKVLRPTHNQFENIRVEDLVSKYFKKADDKSQLMILTENALHSAIQEYIEKDEKDSISQLVNFQIDKTQKYLRKQNWRHEEQIEGELRHFRELRLAQQKEELGEINEIFDKNRTTSKPSTNQIINEDESDGDEEPAVLLKTKSNAIKKTQMEQSDEDFDVEEEKTSKRGAKTTTRGGRGSRGGRGGRGGGRGRGSKANTESTTSQKTQLEMTNTLDSFIKPSAKPTTSRSNFTYKEDDDCDIIDIDVKSKPKYTSTASSTGAKPTTTQSVAKSNMRLQYDEDDSDNDYLPKQTSSSNRSAQQTQNDSNNFSIFQKADATSNKRRKF